MDGHDEWKHKAYASPGQIALEDAEPEEEDDDDPGDEAVRQWDIDNALERLEIFDRMEAGQP